MNISPESVELLIHDISVQGEGIGRSSDGRVVFVPECYPGDRVRVQITGSRGRAAVGVCSEMLELSKDRVESVCTVTVCDGCGLRGIQHDLQLQLKAKRVLDAFKRLGGVDASSVFGGIHCAGEPWYYRHRVRLHSEWSGKQYNFGYRARGSHQLVSLSRCPVLWPELEKGTVGLCDGLKDLPASLRITTVALAYSRRDGRLVAQIQSEAAVTLWDPHLDNLLNMGLAGVDVVGRDGRRMRGKVRLRYDHAYADAFDLCFEPGMFTQACPAVSDLLVSAVQSHARPETGACIVEYHAGIGTFSLPMARLGAHVTAIEINKAASVLLASNARNAGLDISAVCVSDHQALSYLENASVVVMDPPRSGAALLVQAIPTSKVHRVVMVSCDPATLARDGRQLISSGFQLASLDAYDMFAQTLHVESVAVFER